MRKQCKTGVMAFAFLLVAASAMVQPEKAEAKENKKVTATLKNGTLTIKGKGALKKNTKIKNKKKIKKIIVKKGVTSLPIGAFENCKNVKNVTIAASVKSIGQKAFAGCEKMQKLTLPGDFKVKKIYGDDGYYFIGAKADTVIFRSKLNLDVVPAVEANNYVVSKKDPKYQSKNGVIYSKDGKSIVRVPFSRTELVVEEGTEEFCLQSILYCRPDYEGDPAFTTQLTKITLPTTLKTINADKYLADSYNEESTLAEVTVLSKQIDGKSLSVLLHNLPELKEETLMKQLPDQITVVDDMYVTKDGTLLSYIGKAGVITVPQNVKIIGVGAFNYCGTLEKVVLPEGLVEIGESAFECCYDTNDIDKCWEINIPETVSVIGDFAFCVANIDTITLPKNIQYIGNYALASSRIKTLILPEGMKEVPTGLCNGCSYLKSVSIPNSVVKIGERAFSDCRIEPITFGDTLREIGANAFDGIPWASITIPATITKIGAGAFSCYDNTLLKSRTVRIEGSSKNIGSDAFRSVSTILTYTKSAKENKTDLSLDSRTYLKKKGKNRLEFSWHKVTGVTGYQVVFASDEKCKKVIKKVTVKKNKTSATTSYKGKNQEVYGKIRPYKTVNGKKVFGRWSEVACL